MRRASVQLLTGALVHFRALLYSAERGKRQIEVELAEFDQK